MKKRYSTRSDSLFKFFCVFVFFNFFSLQTMSQDRIFLVPPNREVFDVAIYNAGSALSLLSPERSKFRLGRSVGAFVFRTSATVRSQPRALPRDNTKIYFQKLFICHLPWRHRKNFPTGNGRVKDRSADALRSFVWTNQSARRWFVLANQIALRFKFCR